jgi:hypothetical protein
VTADAFAGRCADPAAGAVRLLAGSDESPELANSLALRFPASRFGRRWGALAPLADVVLRIPAGTTGFFFLRDKAILSSLRMAGESCVVEIALTKAKSSCLSMMLRQELQYTTQAPDSRCGQQPCEQLQQNRLKPVSALAVLKYSTQSNNQFSLSSLSSLLRCTNTLNRRMTLSSVAAVLYLQFMLHVMLFRP